MVYHNKHNYIKIIELVCDNKITKNINNIDIYFQFVYQNIL